MTKDYGAWVNLLAHKLKKRMNASLAEYGITGVQSRVLHYIQENSAKGAVFQRDVERAFGLSRSTTTGILQLLERDGVLLRQAVPEDARLKSLVPTEKAAEIEACVHACIQRNEEALTRGISPGQLQVFLEVAQRMAENLDAEGGAG